MAFCRSCGTEVTPGRRFCSTCGTPVGVAAAPPPDADPTVLHVAAPAAAAHGAAGWGGPRIVMAVVGVVLVLLAAGVGAALVLGRADESASGRPTADRDAADAASPTASVTATPSASPEVGESATATTSGSVTPTATASATPTVAALRPVTEAVWSPDYVMIRSYRMQPDGSAVLTYDRVQPDKEGVVPFTECRYETWDDGTFCVLNNATRQRKAGARPTTVVIGTTGTEVALSAGVLDALVTPSGTAMQAARLVTLGVDDTGVVDRIGIAG